MNAEEKVMWHGKLADYGAWGVIVTIVLFASRTYLVPLIEQQQQALSVQMTETPKQTQSLQRIEMTNEGLLVQMSKNGDSLIELTGRHGDGTVAPSDVLEALNKLLAVAPSQVLDEVKALSKKVDDIEQKLQISGPDDEQ